jgi:choline kinase
LWSSTGEPRHIIVQENKIRKNFPVIGTLPSDNQSAMTGVTSCVILAAGASTRLRPLTDAMPKCLLEISGRPLLERTLMNVLAAGMKRIALVLGYRSEMVREFVKQQFPQEKIRYILNPNYAHTNNAYSLLLARRFLEDELEKVNSPFLLLDSDILFSANVLSTLLQVKAPNAIAVRYSGEHNSEEIQIGTGADGYVQFIGKRPDLLSPPCESIGIELFDAETAAILFSVLERRVRHGEGRTEFYEAAFQEMIDNGIKLKAVDVSAFPAMEIDTPEDLERARRLRIDE